MDTEATPYSHVGAGESQIAFRTDAHACYKQSLLWWITEDERYAQNALDIVAAWGETLESHDLSRVFTALYLPPFVWCGELMRHTYRGWTPEHDVALEQIIDVVDEELNFGGSNTNIELSVIDARLAVAVLREDAADWDVAVEQLHEFVETATRIDFQTGEPFLRFDAEGSGWWDEICRDAGHTGQGLAGYLNISEVMYTQGEDFYGHGDGRGEAMLEYAAPLFSGQPVEPPPSSFPKAWADNPECLFLMQDGGPPQIGATGWELGYLHYADRLGHALPATEQLILKNRPLGIQHYGYDTLLHGDMGAAFEREPEGGSSSSTGEPSDTGTGGTGGQGGGEGSEGTTSTTGTTTPAGSTSPGDPRTSGAGEAEANGGDSGTGCSCRTSDAPTRGYGWLLMLFFLAPARSTRGREPRTRPYSTHR